IALHTGQGALDVEAVLQDTVQDRLADLVVVVGLGGDVQRPGAEGLAAITASLVLGGVDVEGGHLAVGQPVNTTVEAALAAAVPATAGARVGLGGATDDADLRHEHGLCSWGAGVTYRCPRTQALSFNPPSTCVALRLPGGGDQHGVSGRGQPFVEGPAPR